MLRRTTFLTAVAAAMVAVSTPAAGAPNDALLDEQWAFSPDTVFDLPAAWDLSQGAGRGRRGRRLRASSSTTPTSRRTSGPTSARSRATASTTTATATSTTSTASTSRAANANQDLHDGFGHGTHVAGTIAAAANGRGVVGVAFRAKLMTVKVLDDRGAGTTGAVAEGIRYAAANGARIINLSLESAHRRPAHARRGRGGRGGQRADRHQRRQQRRQRRPDAGRTRSRSPPRTSSASPRPSPQEGRELPDFSNYGRLTVPRRRARRRRASRPR